jgi:hypothetical protein
MKGLDMQDEMMEARPAAVGRGRVLVPPQLVARCESTLL